MDYNESRGVSFSLEDCNVNIGRMDVHVSNGGLVGLGINIFKVLIITDNLLTKRIITYLMCIL